MRRLAALFAGVALAAACGGAAPIPERDLFLEVAADATEVAVGQGFALTVRRIWDRGLVPAAFSDDSLAPLAVRLLDVVRREDDRRIEERRRYVAYVFSAGDIAVPAAALKAVPRLGGPERSVPGNRLFLRVRPALDPAAPGPVEMPGGLLLGPFPWVLALLCGGAALAVAAGLLALRRRARSRGTAAPAAATPSPPPPGPGERALGRLQRLRVLARQSPAEAEALYFEAESLLRDYLGERFDLPATVMTTEEFLAVPALAGSPADRRGALLSRSLRTLDFVLFARLPLSDGERKSLLDEEEAFVLETCPGEAAVALGPPAPPAGGGRP